MPKAPLRLVSFSVPPNRQAVWNVIHCRVRYSVAIDAIIASGTARVLLNQGGIGMPYVRNSVHRHTIPRRGAKKIGPRAIPVIRVAESASR